jgi:hypothetical protein
VGAAGGAREQLDLQVKLLAGPLHLGHDKAIQPDKAGSVVLHPLFLLAPRSQTTRSLRGAADVSSSAAQPRCFSKTRVFNRPGRVIVHAAPTDRAALRQDVRRNTANPPGPGI